MGSKYVPSVKDAKANQRYQQKQHTQSKFIKPTAKPAPAKKAKQS
jgi:hypothetical protein